MRAVVVLNAKAGSAGTPEDVAEALRAAGIEADVRPVAGPGIPEAAREAAASDADVVVFAGGDGTMNAGASALLGGSRPMGVLPLGTLNHFARDLGIPLSLDEAARTLKTGVVRDVDVGEANGRVFLNNASLGLYPVAVADREARRAGNGRGKWLAMCQAGLATLRRFPLNRVTLHLHDAAFRVTTPLVFIGNNRYEMSLFSLGKRERLDSGELWVYVARDTSRLGIVRLATRAVLGTLDQARDFLATAVPEVVLEDRRRTLTAALDGEVCRLASPVRYRIRPRALRVVVPAP
jgi:diacylglycerol kinase family enzyme